MQDFDVYTESLTTDSHELHVNIKLRHKVSEENQTVEGTLGPEQALMSLPRNEENF
jgi:hypothetical protein